MAIGRSANPVLSEKTFSRLGAEATGGPTMTIEGTINRTFLLLGLLIVAASWTWMLAMQGNVLGFALALPAALAGLVVALVISFVKTTAPYLRGCMRCSKGSWSVPFRPSMSAPIPGSWYPRWPLPSASPWRLLLAYRSGLIRATDNFKRGVIAATGGIFLVYMATFLLGLFGVRMPYIHDGGPIGIIFSLVVVTIAALNLVLDFDFIESGAAHGVPRYMEWYGAFGLLVTLVWLYLEILRLLAKLSGRGRRS